MGSRRVVEGVVSISCLLGVRRIVMLVLILLIVREMSMIVVCELFVCGEIIDWCSVVFEVMWFLIVDGL